MVELYDKTVPVVVGSDCYCCCNCCWQRRREYVGMYLPIERDRRAARCRCLWMLWIDFKGHLSQDAWSPTNTYIHAYIHTPHPCNSVQQFLLPRERGKKKKTLVGWSTRLLTIYTHIITTTTTTCEIRTKCRRWWTQMSIHAYAGWHARRCQPRLCHAHLPTLLASMRGMPKEGDFGSRKPLPALPTYLGGSARRPEKT